MSTQSPLLMGTTVDDLRRKLTSPSSPLLGHWRHFLALSRGDSEWYSPYTVLAALVTGDECDRERARQAVLNFVDLAPEAYSSFEAQFHTHVLAAPLGRWAIFYDWLADAGFFTPEEEKRIEAAFLDLAWTFPLQSLQSRMRAFDNQLLANAFAVTAVGHVFGFKRDNALGRHLYQKGAAWLRGMLSELPEGGYSPEGSTYHEQIVLPLVILSTLLLDETSGVSAPAPRPEFLELLRTSYRLIGPAGLLPAFDAYGFQRAMVKSGLAYLARVSGDGAPLQILEKLQLWHHSAHPAWEMDDGLWALIWWPEETRATSPVFAPWMVPAVGGALQDEANQLRLFQCWDRCGGIGGAGRAQVDPNAVTLEAFGIPVLLDGAGHPGRAVIPIPVEAAREYAGERVLGTVREYRGTPAMSDENALAYAFDGSVGMSNALTFDGEGWYVPREECVGRGEALHHVGPLQVLRADVTDFYTDRYSVRGVKRTSLLARGRYVLVSDRITSDQAHDVTWQAYAREPVRLGDGSRRAIIEAAEGVRCDLIPLQNGTLTLTAADGYPNQWAERRSVAVRHTTRVEGEARLDVALVPQSLLEVTANLSAGWTRSLEGVDGEEPGLDLTDAYRTDPATHSQARRIFRRTVFLAEYQARRVYLRVTMAGPGLRLRVNGVNVPATTDQPGTIWNASVSGQPWVFDITATVHSGENDFELSAPFFHGETLAGAVHLCLGREPVPVVVERIGQAAFSIAFGDEVDHLLCAPEESSAWLGGETDARYALLTGDGVLAAAEVSNLSIPGLLNLEAQAPCDFAWSQDQTELSHLVEGTTVRLQWPGGDLQVDMGGSVEISCHGALPHRVKIEFSGERPLILNGKLLTLGEGATMSRNVLTGTCALTVMVLPAEAARSSELPSSVAELYAQAAHGAGEEILIAALEGHDWRLQVAAAECCGQRGIWTAVPALLELFAAAEEELPYPPLAHWFRWSKMCRAAGELNFEAPETGELAVKRWRVKRAVVTALGLLGDESAIEPLEAALTRGDDFFTVTSQLAVALGRLGASSSIPVLERHVNHVEINTRVHARLALARLRGEISRAGFEQKVGLG